MRTIEARTKNHPYLSKITRDKKMEILDCRELEEEEFQYLCDFPNNGGIRIWIDAEYIDLDGGETK